MDLATLLKTTSPAVLLAVASAAMIVVSLGLGGAIAIGGRALSSWLRATAPDDKAVDTFEKKQLQGFIKAQQAPKPSFLTSLNEPLVISFACFLVAFIAAGLFITPPEVKAEACVPTATTPCPVKPDPPLANVKDAAKANKIVAELPAGNAAKGKALYEEKGCIACHTLDGKINTGPTYQGIYTRAATRKPDYTAKGYIYESIVNPGEYVVEGFQTGIMPGNLRTEIKRQEMADLLAWMEATFK